MPEKGWIALTVREQVGSKIKELAQGDRLTVSEYLEKLISGATEQKGTVKGTEEIVEEWTVCRSCGIKLKTKNLSEHMSKIHKARS